MRKKGDEFYSPMPGAMLTALAASAAVCLLLGCLYHVHQADWMLSCAITCGMIAYHLLIRFAAPVLLEAVTRKRYDHSSRWFREKPWEPALYRRLGVQRWKGHVVSFDPSEFSMKVHTLEEIVRNMCHAEAVHELIILLSFTSLFFAIPFGAFWAFLITAVLAAMVDGVFVVMQRYNRPRIVAILERQKRRLHTQTARG